MQFTLHDPGNVLAVTAVSESGITVAEVLYPNSLLLNAERVEHPWPVLASAQLGADSARSLLAWDPEIVILGTGRRQVFPSLEFAATLMNAGVGCEVMDNHAAARTYNVLVAEGRRVLAALIQEPT